MKRASAIAAKAGVVGTVLSTLATRETGVLIMIAGVLVVVTAALCWVVANRDRTQHLATLIGAARGDRSRRAGTRS